MAQDTEQSNLLDFYNRYNSKKNVLVVQKGIVVVKESLNDSSRLQENLFNKE